MKRKLFKILLILICFCAVTLLSSCDVILDLIFGPMPTNPSDTNEPPAHTHKLEPKSHTGTNCAGQEETISYFKCSDCGKCYLDEEGTKLTDEDSLGSGHRYVYQKTDSQHYLECDLCHSEQQDSRGEHTCDRYWYNPTEHYKLCDVCGFKYDIDSHDETGSCICGRKADYISMCNGRYGYEQLAELFKEHGKDMQNLYKKIDETVTAAHDNANYNANPNVNFGTDAVTGQEVRGYALNNINCRDCSISLDEAKATIACYVNDNPLYYWISKQFALLPDGNSAAGVIIGVVDEYANGKDRVAQNVKIYAEIDSYLSAVSVETNSDEIKPYSITLALHDEIIDRIDYAYNDNGSPEENHWAHSIVGVFDNKAAVCEGYAKAFQLLLNACNVNNVYVTGSSKGEGHAWNLVNLSDDPDNQKWYWYDLTWDDQPASDGGKTYNYFCKKDSVFKLDHDVTVSNVQDGVNYLYELPEAATTDYSELNVWKIDEAVTINDITYKLIGYNRLAVEKVLSVGEDGVATIPSAVIRYGQKYHVKQINENALMTYKEDGSQFGPKIVRLIIPSSVDTIFTKSIHDNTSLVEVHFDDTANWQRYGQIGQKTVVESISADSLSDDEVACRLVKEYKPTILSPYYFDVWIKSAD